MSSDWIACSERMPDGLEDVLVCEWYPHMEVLEDVAMAWRGSTGWIFKREHDGFSVTHWRPLLPTPTRAATTGMTGEGP